MGNIDPNLVISPGGKGDYTPPGYDQRIAGYEAQKQALDAQEAQNRALRQDYSSPYMDNFQQTIGNYNYQQPPPPPQTYPDQPFSQMGGRPQYFAQRGKGGFY